MTEESFNSFLELWNVYAKYVAYGFAGVSILAFLFYVLKLNTIKEFKDRYDFINRSEINTLWYVSVGLIVGIGIFSNTLATEGGLLWFSVRIFITIMLGLIVGVVVSNILKFYYPFYIEKRLKKLRYTPRVNPKTGNKMKLLSEEEEDVYLDEGMQAEENIFSVDYDVWIDEQSGDTKIEKYAGHLHAELSPDSGYYTLKVVKEEIIESPTEEKEGRLIKYYKDIYTGYREKREFKIAKLKPSEVDK